MVKTYAWSSYPAGSELCRNRIGLRFSVRSSGCALFIYREEKIMKENKVANALHTIGVLVIVIGIIGSFICGEVFPEVTYKYSSYSGYKTVESYNWSLALTGVIASFIAGVCFIGFSEVISLLQESADTQERILRKLEDGTKETGPSKTVIQDIEDHLPDM